MSNHVPPAFYEDPAFGIGSVVVIGLLAYIAHQWRIQRIQARGRQLEAVVAARTAELRDAYARLEQASYTDALTGLHNRRFIQQTVDADAATVRRLHEDGAGSSGKSDLIFLLLDLDHFKQVNDKHGHGAGDAVLRQVADILRGLFRAADHVARWGGEEFLVVLRFTDRRRAPDLAEKTRAAIAAHEFRLPDGNVLRNTCSIGVAAYPVNGDAVPWTSAIDVADAALYQAKREGRDRWVSADGGSGGLSWAAGGYAQPES